MNPDSPYSNRVTETVSGIVIPRPGEVRHVRLHEDVLVVSVVPWLLALAKRTERQAMVCARQRGAENATSLLRDMAASARKAASAGWLEDPAEAWPEVARRAALPEWAVEDDGAAERYARRLVQQDFGGAEGAEWAFGVGGDGVWDLVLPPRLAHLLRYVGPFVRGGLAEREELSELAQVAKEAARG